MDAFLPWLIILAMAVFALSGIRQRKSEPTVEDRRFMALAALPALIVTVAIAGYFYLH